MLNLEKATLENYSSMSHQTHPKPIARPQQANPPKEDASKEQDEMFFIDLSDGTISLPETQAPNDPNKEENSNKKNPQDQEPRNPWDSSSESESGDSMVLAKLKKSSVDYPCCTPEMRNFFKRRKELQWQYQKLQFDWKILDRICLAKAIEKEVCEACKATRNSLYLMLSTYGARGPMKVVLHCVCTELDGKYFPLNETLSINFATSDTITAIYNFVRKNEDANKFLYGSASENNK